MPRWHHDTTLVNCAVSFHTRCNCFSAFTLESTLHLIRCYNINIFLAVHALHFIHLLQPTRAHCLASTKDSEASSPTCTLTTARGKNCIVSRSRYIACIELDKSPGQQPTAENAFDARRWMSQAGSLHRRSVSRRGIGGCAAVDIVAGSWSMGRGKTVINRVP